jgi:hypothetical protein
MMKLFVEELKEMYAVLDNAIQNSYHTDFEQCYSALAELCECALCGLDKYKGVASVPDLIKMFKRDMKYVQGLMGKEEEKAYLDDEWKRLTGKEEGKA